MSLKNIGLFWSESTCWVISCNEQMREKSGVLKTITVRIGDKTSSDWSMIPSFPFHDSLGEALTYDGDTQVIISSTHRLVVTSLKDLLATFSHNMGPLIKILDNEFLIHEMEFIFVKKRSSKHYNDEADSGTLNSTDLMSLQMLESATQDRGCTVLKHKNLITYFART